MKIINIIIGEETAGKCLPLGRRGEHDVLQYRFDLSRWVEMYGDGELTIKVRRNGDAEPYTGTLERVGHDALWTISARETDKAGAGRVEFKYTTAGKRRRVKIQDYDFFVIDAS